MTNEETFSSRELSHHSDLLLAYAKEKEDTQPPKFVESNLDFLQSQLSESIFDALLKLGGDINLQDASGSTILHSAVSATLVEDVYILLKLGADVNICNGSGCSPVWSASWKGSTSIVKLLHQYGADINKPDNDG